MDFDQYLSLDDKEFTSMMAQLDEEPKVDVIITSYKQSTYLEQCLKSILKQTVRISSITLVNHCPDEIEIKKFDAACSIFMTDSRVKILHLGECWPGEARNKAAKDGNAPFIAFIDVDDWISSRFFESALMMIATTNSDFVGADCAVFNSDGFIGTWNLKSSPTIKDLVQTNAFPVSSVVKRKMYSQLNGWNDFDYHGRRQDEAIDFWRRSMLNNFQGSNVRQQLIHLRRHNLNLSSLETSLVSTKALKASFKTLIENSDFPKCRKIKRKFSVPTFKKLVESISNFKMNPDKDTFLILIADGTVFGAGKVTHALVEKCIGANKNVIIVNFDYRSQGIPLAEKLLDVHWIEFGSVVPRHAWLQTLELWIKEIEPTWILSLGHPDVDLLLGALRRRDLTPKIASAMFNTKSLHSSFLVEHPGTYDRFLVESNFSKNWLISNGIDKEKIEIIRHLAHRLPENDTQKQPDLEFEEGILLGWFHRFSWEKQPSEFLKIANAITANEYKFVMGGSGPLRAKIEKESNSEKIKFEKENVSNVQFLKRLDVAFMTSSEVEGRPLAALEALELGKVLIAYNVGAMKEIADLGYEGIYLFDTSSEIIDFINNNKILFANFKVTEKNRSLRNIEITDAYVSFRDSFVSILT
jgi:glycosyltransferase involved in cell wall biosynthesis